MLDRLDLIEPESTNTQHVLLDEGFSLYFFNFISIIVSYIFFFFFVDRYSMCVIHFM